MCEFCVDGVECGMCELEARIACGDVVVDDGGSVSVLDVGGVLDTADDAGSRAAVDLAERLAGDVGYAVQQLRGVAGCHSLTAMVDRVRRALDALERVEGRLSVV